MRGYRHVVANSEQQKNLEGIGVDLSVIILSWNTCGLLEKCLRSLECQHESGVEVELIVADNASEDGSRAMVAREFPQVHLVVNKKNLGFGAGNNAALPHTHGRYVLFLNSDTVVTDGALAAMVRYADANPNIGILGPKLLNGDGSLQYSCRRYPNLATGFFRNTPLGRLFPQNRFASDYLMQDWDHATPRDVDWVSGAALMIRRTLLDRIGGFDEDYYMYCEDVDLCWRANHAAAENTGGQENAQSRGTVSGSQTLDSGHEAGTGNGSWRVTYYPDAVIYHLIGKSSDLAPTRMTYEFHRSQYLFYQKHYRRNTPWIVRPVIPVGIMLRAVGQMSRYQVRYWQRRLRGREKPRRKR
jgi:GT2 family glycosyltransferase